MIRPSHSEDAFTSIIPHSQPAKRLCIFLNSVEKTSNSQHPQVEVEDILVRSDEKRLLLDDESTMVWWGRARKEELVRRWPGSTGGVGQGLAF